MSVYRKLNSAREKFHGLKLTKTGNNKFAGYKYFELGDFLVPAMRVFNEVGLCAVVTFEQAVARMRIIDVDDPQSIILIESPMGSAALKGCHEVQNIGAVETYQRRYLWVAALEIVEHDALEATTGSPEQSYEAKPRKKSGVMADVKATLPELNAEEEAYFNELAAVLVDANKAGNDAHTFDLLGQENLDNDQKLQLWAKLPSDVRASLKRESKARQAN